MKKRWALVVVGLGVAGAAWGQAPAGAPAGANGICKDGTYSTAASKDGACRGHKGVQTWYAASSAAKPSGTSPKTSAVAPATAPASAKTSAITTTAPASRPAVPASRPAAASAAPVSTAPAAPAPAAAPARPSQPAASSAVAPSAPATSATAARRSGPAAAAASKPQAAGGGPGLVWVNTASNVYHCPGTDFYGKTKAGSYMSEADAKAKGARPDRGKACTQ